MFKHKEIWYDCFFGAYMLLFSQGSYCVHVLNYSVFLSSQLRCPNYYIIIN